MAENDIAIRAISKLSLKRGDSLVLYMAESPSELVLQRFRDQLETVIGFQVLIVVMGYDDSVLVLSPKEKTDED